jgi:peptidoglycan/xylan/chitin deacetylase (PgdA/CDA1 family)
VVDARVDIVGLMTHALIYHDVARSGREDLVGFPGAAAARYKLDPERFESHLDAIAAARVTVGLIEERPDAALTFDDGGASALLIADALERRAWRGHFFIVTGRIGTAGFLDPDGVRELARRGHGVGSHSESHPTYMGTLSRTELAGEWRRSRASLADILGAEPATAAVPGGFVSRAVIEEAARAGYGVLMTSHPSSAPWSQDGIQVHGRYTVWRATTAARASAYARGAVLARSTLWLSWQVKGAPKRLSPRAYELVRQRWASARHRR